MGTVYLAEQRDPIRRLVALKVVKLGMDTAQVLARFNNERQALAMMDHPNIAQIFDAGATTKGRPYFVMEYIEGAPITQYCDRKRMTTRERLALFLAVCRAIQHAHQKGVIHRDLKPSNVLVMEQDGAPVPKGIDFGIAKAADKWAVENTPLTPFGQILGTPEYASPEQAGERRYASVSDVVADIQRHMEDRPVLASPPGGLYRTRKFLLRHRLAALGTAVGLVFLVLSGVTAWSLSHRDSTARPKLTAK